MEFASFSSAVPGILVFGALLSMNKRNGIKLSFWALNDVFFPLLILRSAFFEVLSSIFTALCFCSVNFSVSIQKSRDRHSVMHGTLNRCPRFNTTPGL